MGCTEIAGDVEERRQFSVYVLRDSMRFEIRKGRGTESLSRPALTRAVGLPYPLRSHGSGAHDPFDPSPALASAGQAKNCVAPTASGWPSMVKERL